MLIQPADHASDELLDALARLLPQLKISLPRFTPESLAGLLASDSVTLLTARVHAPALSTVEGSPILGIAALIIYPTPTGIRARIEDLVVDESARGRGVATALISSALEIARQKGADGVALTSNPRRESANRLYQKLGFARWETNVYFLKFRAEK